MIRKTKVSLLLTYPLLGLCLPLTSCTRVSANANGPAEAVPVRATLARVEDVPLELTAVGNVEAMQSVDVKSRLDGLINTVSFTEGQSVTKGQLLFRMDHSALERQAAEQQAEVERDVAMEQQSSAIVARDEAAEKQSQSEAEVAQKLGELGVISLQRVGQLATVGQTAHAALRSDQAAVQAASGSSKADRARLQQTRLQLQFTNIVAPISGRAGAVMTKAGSMVRSNDTTLATLLQLAPIYVTFGIPEQSLPEVQRLSQQDGLVVNAYKADASPRQGRLAFIDNTVDATTGTVRLKAVFTNADHSLWPGEFVDVRLRMRMDLKQTLVPETSIQNGLDGKYVWIAKNGTATIAPVTVLRTYKPQHGPQMAVVGSGVQPGDLIVTEGQMRLTAGSRISLLNSPA